MARRVNTQFVVILGGGMFIVAVGILGFWLYRTHLDKDPKVLTQRAVQEEKAGHLELAMFYYSKAANESAKAHISGADEMYLKAGELAMTLSASESDQYKAGNYYNDAKKMWVSAVNDNPQNIKAQRKLLDEQFKIASFNRSVGNWTAIDEAATKYIRIDPKYPKVYLYRATARLALAKQASLTGDIDPARLTTVDEDVQKAMTMDPSAAPPVILYADLLQTRADVARGSGITKEAGALDDASVVALQVYLTKNPHEPEATEMLSALLWKQKQADQAVKLLQDAIVDHPSDIHLLTRLASFNMTRNPQEAEAVFKSMIAANPSDPDVYVELSEYYQLVQKPADAIEALKQALQHPNTGGGISALMNIQRQTSALKMISWFYMDIAEREGMSSAKGADAYAQAINYANQLRTAQSSRAMLDLLDGRLHLLKGNLSEAIASLKRADDVYGVKGNYRALEWREVKMLLAQAYKKKTEWGNELTYVEQYLAVYPKWIPMVLERGNVLIAVARYNDALAVVHDISHPGPKDNIAPELVTAAKRIEAQAQLGLGMHEAYLATMQELGGIEGQLAVVVNLMANNEMQKALEGINNVLQTAPDNERAYALAININLRLGAEGKVAAETLLDKAIEKFPKNSQFQFLKARLNSPEGDTIDTLVKAAEGITDDYARNVYIAQLYLQAHDRDKAIKYFNEAMKSLEKSLTDSSRDLLSHVCDQAFTLTLAAAQEDHVRSVYAANEAAKAGNAADKDKALQEKAKSDAEADKYMEQAKIYSQKAEGLNLDGANGKLYQGRMLFAQGGDARSSGLAILEQVVASQPDNAAAHTVLGMAYLDMTNISKALEEFQKALSQKPDSLLALRYAIDLLIRKGDEQSMSQAQKYLQTALAFAPQDPMLRKFYDLVGNVHEAIRMREATLAQHPDDIDNIESLIRLYVKDKNLPKAIELLQPLYNKNLDNLEMANTLANYYREDKKYQEGSRIYEHFLGNSDPMIRFEATILNGDFYRSCGQYEQAVATFKNAMRNEPAGRDDAEARLADLYFEMDDMPNAETVYAKIYDHSATHDVRVARRLTEVLINEGKFEQSEEILSGILKANPQDIDGLNLRGYSLLKQHKSAESIAAFNAVVKAHPDNVDALHYRALAQYTLQGDLDQAMADLLVIRSRGQELLLNNRGGILINSLVLLARVYRLDRKYAEAAAEYDEILKMVQASAPSVRVEYAQFLLSLVEVYYRITPDNHDDFAQSIRVVKPDERLVELLKDSEVQLPGQPMWLVLEGNFMDMQAHKALRDKSPQAVQLAHEAQLRYEAAFKNSKGNPQAASPYLSSLLDARQYQQVVDVATQLINDQPKYGDYYVKRGAAYASLHDKEHAMADFHAAMDLSAGDLTLYLTVVRQARIVLTEDVVTADLQARLAADKSDSNDIFAMAEGYLVANRGKDAVDLLKPLLEQPKLQSEKPRILRMIAMGKFEAKDYEGASKDYRDLLKIAPDDIEALNNFAFMLADNMKQFSEAMTYAERAVKILRQGKVDVAFVNNGNVYDTYGWVKYLSGDTSGAVMELKKAIQIEPNPIAYLHLSKALAKDNHSLEARKALEDGIQLAKANSDRVLPQLEAAIKELH